jgi:hypothetical protein
LIEHEKQAVRERYLSMISGYILRLLLNSERRWNNN